MIVCEEMKKLRTWLDKQGIQWEDKSESFTRIEADTGKPCYMCRTHFCLNGCFYSVINGIGSYGGIDYEGNNHGLLEVMSDAINGGTPIGGLTFKELKRKLVE